MSIRASSIARASYNAWSSLLLCYFSPFPDSLSRLSLLFAESRRESGSYKAMWFLCKRLKFCLFIFWVSSQAICPLILRSYIFIVFQFLKTLFPITYFILFSISFSRALTFLVRFETFSLLATANLLVSGVDEFSTFILIRLPDSSIRYYIACIAQS